MLRFFETIKIQDGLLCFPEDHQRRFDLTRQHHFPSASPIFLNEVIEVPESSRKGTVRCRVDYADTILSIGFFPYQISDHRQVLILESPTLQYRWKYADRSCFTQALAENPGMDDIIFTHKGFLTDTTFSHLALLRQDRWYTPESYLLPGTKRARLLKENRLSPLPLRPEDLVQFEALAFINAMRDFEKIHHFELNGHILSLKPSTL